METPIQNDCPFKRIEEQMATAKEFGFYWDNLLELIEQAQSECTEVKKASDAGDQTHLQEEIGDLLNIAVCLGIFCGFDPKETLSKSHAKFQKRYDALVQLAAIDDRNTLHGASPETLWNYWTLAKQAVS